MRNVNLFVDMDGVLAEYHKNIVEHMYKKGFFLNRPPVEVMVEVVKKLSKQNENIYILSSVIDSPYCEKEKDLWLNKHLPEITSKKRFYVPYGVSKSSYINDKLNISNSTNVLIDDLTKNLKEWTQVPKALPIKFLNGINNTKGTWLSNQGRYVSIQNTAEEIVQYINRHIQRSKNII